jgi:PAS domain S-box-containing protein
MFDHSFLDLIEDYILAIDDDGKISWANRSFVSLFGYEQTISGKAIIDFIYKYDTPGFSDFILNNSPNTEYFDARLVQSSKFPIWVRWKKKKKTSANPFFLIGKQNEMFNVTDENFIKIATDANISYFEYSLIDKCIPLNPTLRQILGINTETSTIHYDDYVSCIVEEDVEKFSKWWLHCLTNNETAPVEYRILNKNGELKNIRSFAQNLINNSGTANRRRVFLQDISQLNESLMLLKQSEEQLWNVYNNSPIAILYANTNGKVININNAGIQLLELSSRKESLQVNLLKHPLLIENGISQQIANCITNKVSNIFENQYITKSDKKLWLKIQVTPFNTIYKGIETLMVIFEDITREINAKQNLEIAEQRNRIILQAIPDLILVVDNYFQIVDVHQSLQTESAERDVTIEFPKTLMDNFPDHIFHLFARKLQAARKTGQVISFEYEFLEKNEKKYFESRIVKVDSRLSLIIIRDITESRESKQQLILSESRLLSAQRMAHLGWYEALIEEHGFIASEEAFRIFFEQPINRAIPEQWIFERIHPEDVDYFKDTVGSNIQKKSDEFSWEFRIITPNGKIKHISSKAFLSFDQDGILIRRFGIVQDITQRKEAEKALAQSEARLSEAQKTAKVGWYEVLLETDEYIGSLETYQIFFFTDISKPIKSSELLQIIHHEDRLSFINTLTKHIESRSKQFTLNYRIISQDGVVKYLIITGNLEVDDSGNISRRYGTVQDVTQFRTYELALAKSETRLKEAQSIARLGYFEFSSEAHRSFISAEAIEIIEIKSEEVSILNKIFYKFIHPDDLELFIQQINDPEIQRINITIRLITPLNNIKHVHLVIDKTIENGMVISVKGTIQDITEQVAAKQAIELSESKFRGIFEGSPAGIVIFDKSGRFIQANQAFYHMVNITENTHLDRYNLFKDRNIPDKIKKQIALNDSISFETLVNYTFLKPTKELNFQKQIPYFEYKIRTISNESYLMMVTDISERKKLEIELIAAKEKAEESDSLKSAFLANMSHEIRTPMNAILGFASLLELDGYTEEERTNFIRTISINGQHLLNLINDIIDVSKIEANQLSLQLSYIKINDILADIELLMSNLVPSKVSFSLQYGLGDDQAIVYSDEQRVKQILINLINNAFKFTESGEVVFGYQLKKDKNQLQFFVSDTGCGIPENKAQEIFHRFHQLDHIKQGAGLGLSISKGLVILLGGNIWVDTQLGKGSTFYFTLPYQAP